MNEYYFPFGQKLTKVQQANRTSNKEAFVLSVYACAAHAKWINPDSSVKVQALAVTSEPEIFWKGDGVERIISDLNRTKSLNIDFPNVGEKSQNLPIK